MGGRTTFVTCAAVAAVLLLGGCGSATREPTGAGRASPSPSASPAYLYTCGQTLFDPALLEGPGGVENDDSELGEALRDLMETVDGEFLQGAEHWRVVVDEGDRVEVIGRAAGRFGYMNAIFERSGGSWKPAGWGDCEPDVFVPGNRSPATWELVKQPSPDDTKLVVDATERACASGRQLTERDVRSDVSYGEDAITIVVSADSLVGGECPDNPPVRLTISLHEPIGDRELLDASVYPPKRRYP